MRFPFSFTRKPDPEVDALKARVKELEAAAGTAGRISAAMYDEMTPRDSGRVLTLEQIRRMYGPARTLGAPEDVRLAMDNNLAVSGTYSLLQHTLEMGQAVFPEFLGYGTLQNLSQQGMMRACIGTVADDMTRAWIELQRQGKIEEQPLSERERLAMALRGDMTAPEQPVEDTLIPDILNAMDKCGLRAVVHETIELMGYEGGAFIYIDTGVQGEARLLPLDVSEHSAELVQGGHLRFVAIDPVNVFPGDYDMNDPLSPYFYKPRYWWVLGQRVHSSRMLRLVANEVPVLLKPSYNFLGMPQAQILWDYISHFNEARTAANRLLTKFSMTVFQTAMFDGVNQFGTEQAAYLDRRLQMAAQNMSNDGIFAIDKENEGVVKLETPLSGVTDIVRQSLEIIAAMNRTPAVKLLGISPSGFNATGESDIRNYYDHVASMQEKVMRKPLARILDCIQLNLRGVIDPALTFTFAPLGDDDKAAVVNTQKVKVDTMCALVDRNVITVEEARQSLATDPDSGFNDIDPDSVQEDEISGEDDASHPGRLDSAGGGAFDADKAGQTSCTGGFRYVLVSFDYLDELQAADAGNEEQLRDDDGKFASCGVRGQKIEGVKGRAAIEKLLSTGTAAFVENAFERQDIGGIDLVWGDERGGLCHIDKRRKESAKINMQEFYDRLTETIETGEMKYNENSGNYEILLNGQMAVVAPHMNSNADRQSLLTAFKTRKKHLGN